MKALLVVLEIVWIQIVKTPLPLQPINKINFTISIDEVKPEIFDFEHNWYLGQVTDPRFFTRDLVHWIETFNRKF